MISGECDPSSRKFIKPLDLMSLIGQAGILAGLPYPPGFLWVMRNQLFCVRARLISCLCAGSFIFINSVRTKPWITSLKCRSEAKAEQEKGYGFWRGVWMVEGWKRVELVILKICECLVTYWILIFYKIQHVIGCLKFYFLIFKTFIK